MSAQTVGRQQEATSCVLPTPDSSLELRHPQANRVTDKLTYVHDRIYCCRSGSAADTQAVADVVHMALQQFAYAFALLSLELRINFKPVDNPMAGLRPCMLPQHYSNRYAILTKMRSLPASSSLDGTRRLVRACITFLLAAVSSASLGRLVVQDRRMSMVTVMRHIRRVGGVTRRLNLSRTVSRLLILSDCPCAHIAQRSRWPWLAMVHQEASFVWQ